MKLEHDQNQTWGTVLQHNAVDLAKEHLPAPPPEGWAAWAGNKAHAAWEGAKEGAQGLWQQTREGAEAVWADAKSFFGFDSQAAHAYFPLKDGVPVPTPGQPIHIESVYGEPVIVTGNTPLELAQSMHELGIEPKAGDLFLSNGGAPQVFGASEVGSGTQSWLGVDPNSALVIGGVAAGAAALGYAAWALDRQLAPAQDRTTIEHYR